MGLLLLRFQKITPPSPPISEKVNYLREGLRVSLKWRDQTGLLNRQDHWLASREERHGFECRPSQINDGPNGHLAIT